MKIFITILSIFLLFSFLGWCLEVIYRSIRNKRFINPGFMVGVTLPIYGAGALILYLIFLIDLKFITGAWEIVLKIIFSSILLTLIEFVAGYVALKVYHNRLWDYSHKKFNIMGLICPEFSFYWTLLTIVFYYLFYPWLGSFGQNVYLNQFLILILGISFGIFLVDLIYSIKLLDKIRSYAIQLQQTVDFENLKRQVREKTNNGLKRIKGLSIFKITYRVSHFIDEESRKIHERLNKNKKN